MANRLNVLFCIFCAMFAACALWLVKIAAYDAPSIVANPYNARLYMSDDSVRRGSIFDRDMNPLAQTDLEAGRRLYPMGYAAAHVVGAVERGKSGLERFANFYLENVHLETLRRAAHVILGEDVVGDSIVATIDAGFQEEAAKLLLGKTGAIAIIEVGTGGILALASSPSFDPRSIADDWGDISTDEAAPLINRATQGLYPPGSTFKTFSAIAALTKDAAYADREYVCEGSVKFADGKVIRCFDNKKHGKLNMEEALAVSCNCYFATLGEEVGAAALSDITSRFGFNAPVGFGLDESVTRFSLPEIYTESEITETYIGQGKTLATPLLICKAYSTIAGGGIAVKPNIIDSVIDMKGNTVKRFETVIEGEVISPELADILDGMLERVITNGTGGGALVKGVIVAGKTGTAENESGKDHSLFAGYAAFDNQKPQIALCVIMERADGRTKAADIAGALIEYYSRRR